MQQDIMQQGVDLVLYGMGSVFVFLTVLVIATTIMSSFVQRFLPDAPLPQPAARPAPAASGVNDPKLLAILQAAVTEHRKKQQS